MTEARVVDLREVARVPWRNGMGSTREIAAGDGWRLSIADIENAAAFSAFPGLVRTSCVVAGAGLVLVVDGVERPAPAGHVVGYDGGVPVEARLLEGPVLNLNLFVRRGERSGTMVVHRVTGAVTWPAATALVLMDGAAETADGSPWTADQVVLPGGTPWSCRRASSATVVEVAIR